MFISSVKDTKIQHNIQCNIVYNMFSIISLIVKVANSNCSKKTTNKWKQKQIYYCYNKEKGRTSLYLKFREWDLQKAFCLIIKP